ncbi:alcohol oxidase [Dendrothele bispora CBS 962.96]|uniref:Alcohol oxidase n=1 Tax=Dendrothele bispora (strain CBS 962.96) TaxID=1314807 RepID=A0A4V4HGN8_DENBC|nr:alcohol oxidase [Dendrothele bispora CBS 962.96]
MLPICLVWLPLAVPAFLPPSSAAFAPDKSQGYDYIIVGGGLSGLTLANRLSENPGTSVLVLEAGSTHFDDPLIDIPGNVGMVLGNSSYDWNYVTVPQPYANNRSFQYHRGKGLGGSTSINYMVWNRPAIAELDAIGGLGNPGWNAEDWFRYMRKSETFTHPEPEFAAANNLTFIPEAHGDSGPVHTSFPIFISDAQKPWEPALSELGLLRVKDPLAGHNVGIWMGQSNVNNKTQKRFSSSEAYYRPIANERPNLTVWTSAFVTKILVSDHQKEAPQSREGLLSIPGVQYQKNGETKYAYVKDRGEVILSAGFGRSSQLLELAGIGDPRILEPLGIDVKINLPGVGTGIIDQLLWGVSYELKNSSIVTLDDIKIPELKAAALAEYDANKTGLMTIGVTAYSLVTLDDLVGHRKATEMIDIQATKISRGNFSQTQKEKWNVIINGLRNPSEVGLVEISGFPAFFTTAKIGKKYLTFLGHYQFPFSSGTVHIVSKDVNVQPAMDPHYFEDNFDSQVFIESTKLIRKMARAGGFADVLGDEIDPGMRVQSDEEILEYVKNFSATAYHTVGSAQMLPREKGGVVSPELKVYGTNNLRVVDMSVLPLQFSSHPMGMLYGVAEKAADIIKSSISV